jgi:hypothetical protein
VRYKQILDWISQSQKPVENAELKIILLKWLRDGKFGGAESRET